MQISFGPPGGVALSKQDCCSSIDECTPSQKPTPTSSLNSLSASHKTVVPDDSFQTQSSSKSPRLTARDRRTKVNDSINADSNDSHIVTLNEDDENTSLISNVPSFSLSNAHSSNSSSSSSSSSSKHTVYYYQRWPGKNQFFCFGRFMTGPRQDWLSVAPMWATFILGGFLFFSFVCPSIWVNFHPILVIPGIINYIACAILVLLCMFTDPGILPRHPDVAIKERKDKDDCSTGTCPTKPNHGHSHGPSSASAAHSHGGHSHGSHSHGGGGGGRSHGDHSHGGHSHGHGSSPAPEDEESTEQAKLEAYKLLHPRFCTTCRIEKPLRASHCRACDNCIEVFDHHCVWLGTCIGKRNYMYFTTLLSSLSFGAIYGMTICILQTMYIIYHSERVFFRDSVWSWTLLSTVLLLLFMRFCCFYQSWNDTFQALKAQNEAKSVFTILHTPLMILVILFLSIPIFLQGVFDFTMQKNPVGYFAAGILLVFALSFSSFSCYHCSLIRRKATTKEQLTEKKQQEELKIKSKDEFFWKEKQRFLDQLKARELAAAGVVPQSSSDSNGSSSSSSSIVSSDGMTTVRIGNDEEDIDENVQEDVALVYSEFEKAYNENENSRFRLCIAWLAPFKPYWVNYKLIWNGREPAKVNPRMIITQQSKSM